MSALRDRRVRIYGYVDAGANGFVSATYVFRCERWAAVNQRTAVQQNAGAVAAQAIDAVIDFALQVDVRYGDLLVDGAARYFARGITQQHGPDAQLVTAERVPREVYAALILANVAEIDDGHIADAYELSVMES